MAMYVARRHAAVPVRTDNALARLLERWSERDAHYRRGGRYALTEEAAAAVREWRQLEVLNLPVVDREEARKVLAHWSPPERPLFLLPAYPSRMS